MIVLSISLMAIVIGALCIFFENNFYQYVDEHGVLHESLFMPIGSLLLLFGAVGIVYSMAKLFMQSIKKRS